MLVVATTTNFRRETPTLDLKEMMKCGKVTRNANWFPIFKRNCKRVVVTGDSWHSLVSIRGSLFEFRNDAFDEIRVGGTRCPIHRVERICNLGNKTIVDLVVALDPTGIYDKGSGWTFDVEFPLGFTPMCFASNKSSLQYLAILFQSIGIVAVDVTPVSYTLIWDITEKCKVDLDSKTIAEGQYHKLEVLNATPGRKTQVKVQSENNDAYATVEVETPEISVDFMHKFYLSRKKDNNIFNLEGVRNETIIYLRKNGILKSGQEVKFSCVEDESLKKTNETTTSRTVSVVVSGDTVPLTVGKSMYVVPDFSVDHNQYICLEDESLFSHVIEFDKSESYVKYKDKVYPHGSFFSVAEGSFSRRIGVVQGSIILVVENEVADFPGGSSTALQVLTSGDLIVRDLVMRCSSQVTEKVDGDTTYGRNSFFMYNPDDDTTKECTRVSHGLNDTGDTGSMSIDLLYTNENSDESLLTTYSSDPTQTSIRATNSSETVTATFNAGGLSFDSDNGNIYFGAEKDFRIHFEDQSGLDPAMLQIQSLAEDGTYVTRFLITAEPP